MATLEAEVRLRNCLCVYLHRAKLLISMFHSILNFTFYLVLWSFLTFLGPIGLFWRSGGG